MPCVFSGSVHGMAWAWRGITYPCVLHVSAARLISIGQPKDKAGGVCVRVCNTVSDISASSLYCLEPRQPERGNVTEFRAHG